MLHINHGEPAPSMMLIRAISKIHTTSVMGKYTSKPLHFNNELVSRSKVRGTSYKESLSLHPKAVESRASLVCHVLLSSMSTSWAATSTERSLNLQQNHRQWKRCSSFYTHHAQLQALDISSRVCADSIPSIQTLAWGPAYIRTNCNLTCFSVQR